MRRRETGIRFCGRLAAGAIATALLWPLPGLAHGGGLDSLGCHHDRKHGGYHCHRGPLAGKSFQSKEEAVKAMQSLPPASGKKQ